MTEIDNWNFRDRLIPKDKENFYDEQCYFVKKSADQVKDIIVLYLNCYMHRKSSDYINIDDLIRQTTQPKGETA